MKIAVVVSTYPPYRGGMGNVARDHAEALKRAGHDVMVFAPGAGLAPLFRIGNAAVVPQLLWKLRGFDIVELHYPFFGGAEWVLLWKMILGQRARLVTMYHMDAVGKGILGAIFGIYKALFLKAILNASDRIIVTSKNYAASSDIVAFTSTVKTFEVPLAVDVERFRPDGASADTVLFVGGLDSAHYFKGVTVLLRAFAETIKQHLSARLQIVGDGDLRVSYEVEAKRLGIAERVTFMGKVADEQLPEIYRKATFHVLPSVDRSEAFGLVTLEAAASGIPSIVSDLPGVRSVVVEGETGVIVPPGDVSALSEAMSRLLGDQGLTRRMGEAARKRTENRYAKKALDPLIVRVVVE